MSDDRIKQFTSEKFINQLESDTSMMSDKDKKLVELCLNKEWANPKFKLKWFVGETQITPFAKLRQWLLEIKGREETIETMEYDINKWQIEIERQEYLAEHATDQFDKKLAKLEVTELTRKQVMSKRRLWNWYLERQQLIDLVNEFMESDEAYLPDGSGRTYLDIIDTDEEDVYEAEYWTNRLAKQASTDLLFYGRVGTGNMDAILSMSPEQQTETLALAVSHATQLGKIQENLQLEVNNSLQSQRLVDNSSLTMPLQVGADEKVSVTPTDLDNDEEDILNVYNS